MSARDFSFVRRPVWIVGHVIAVGAVVGFILLGQWQLSRHTERQALDDTLRVRLDQPAVPYADLAEQDIDTVEYRPTTLNGSYRTEDEVILQARSLAGVSGHEVVTPLEMTDGRTILVNRGWVPIDVVGPPVAGAEPPSGPVTVTGFLRPTEIRGGLGPVDPAEGRLDRVSRVDIGRIQQQVDTELEPVYVVLSAQEPAQSDFPRPVPPPEPGGGPPHLSYAVQWFLFAAVVAIGYPVLLFRSAQGRRHRKPG